MNRTPFATAAVASTSHLQQGLFVLFAVLMTLLACTAFHHLTEKPEPLLRAMPHAASQHFAPVSSRSGDMLGANALEQTAEVNAPVAPQQRFTF